MHAPWRTDWGGEARARTGGKQGARRGSPRPTPISSSSRTWPRRSPGRQRQLLRARRCPRTGTGDRRALPLGRAGRDDAPLIAAAAASVPARAEGHREGDRLLMPDVLRRTIRSRLRTGREALRARYGRARNRRRLPLVTAATSCRRSSRGRSSAAPRAPGSPPSRTAPRSLRRAAALGGSQAVLRLRRRWHRFPEPAREVATEPTRSCPDHLRCVLEVVDHGATIVRSTGSLLRVGEASV